MSIEGLQDLKNHVDHEMLAYHHAAVEQLKSQNDPHEKVHEVRKLFKKIRGSLRLIRFSFQGYKEFNVFYRDLGRELSYIRDCSANIETVERLESEYEDEGLITSLKKQLQVYRASNSTDLKKRLDSILADLVQFEDKISNPKYVLSDIDQLTKGVDKSYKRARKQYDKCCKSKENEIFHNLRKRVKYLRYQMQLIHFMRVNLLSAYEKEYAYLSGLLGDENDLHNLKQVINSEQFLSDDDTHHLTEYLIRKQKNIQKEALTFSSKILDMKRQPFRRQIYSAWNSHLAADEL